MEEKYIQKIAEKLSLSLKAVTNVYKLHSDGSTIPFIARYRKEELTNAPSFGLLQDSKQSQ